MPSKERTLKEMCERTAADAAAEHLVVCPVCGQVFDCRDAEAMSYHAGDNTHGPRDCSRR